MTENLKLNAEYWESRYMNQETGWDIGYPSTPLKVYFDQIEDKDQKILIPGAGNAYEAEYLHKHGFTNVHVIDLTSAPFTRLLKACPDFPKQNLHVGDFFDHEDQYDLIIEQTFFCAMIPDRRKQYVEKMKSLLQPDGKLVGLLFDAPLFTDHPPFGGNKQEYQDLFSESFDIEKMETAFNSIEPRAGQELFIKLRPKK